MNKRLNSFAGRMKTIAVIGTRGFPGIQGGVEMHCLNIYPHITEARFRVYRRKPYLTAESRARYANITFVDLPSTRIKGFEALFHTLISVIHIIFHRVDVVHIHNIGPGLFAPVLRLFGFKVVMTYHSANYEHKKWGRLARALLRLSEWVSLRWCNRIIFVNKFQMEKYPARIMRKSIYIPNGLEQSGAVPETDFLCGKGIEPGNYLLAVGRITPEKGFHFLIEAIQQCAAVSRLVIAGGSDHDSTYLDRLKALDTRNKVIFTGFTAGRNLAQLYSHARLFVLPSVNEGFPLVLLEALGYGLQVVVSDIPATHLMELPTECYFECGNVEQLRAVLTRTLENEQATADYGIDVATYSWPNIAAQTGRVLIS